MRVYGYRFDSEDFGDGGEGGVRALGGAEDVELVNQRVAAMPPLLVIRKDTLTDLWGN